MRDALAASGRPIYYSICNWGADAVYTWGLITGNSWRVSSDVGDSWSSVAGIAAANSGLSSYAGPGGFNDFDMLEIGNGGLTAAEERAHFALWAIAKSPLLIGTDLTKISSASLAVLLNAVCHILLVMGKARKLKSLAVGHHLYQSRLLGYSSIILYAFRSISTSLRNAISILVWPY